MKVSASVINEGKYALWETVQVYVKRKESLDYEPGFQLKGVSCVHLAPGEKQRIEVTLSPRDFAYITE